MKRSSLLLAVIAVSSLSACDYYSEKMAALDSGYVSSSSSDVTQIAPAAGASSIGGTMDESALYGGRFSDHLKREYIERAHYEESVADYKAAKRYTECAYALAEGQLVAPASVGKDIPEDQRQALDQARALLIDALKTKNIPQNREALAKAQVSFDCWVDQSTEAKEHSPCQQSFVQAMASLAEPDRIDKHYQVLFEDNKISLNSADREVIGEILRHYADKEDVMEGIELVGGSDTLSTNRLSVLRSILQYNGIPAEKIKQSVRAEAGSDSSSIDVIVRERVPQMVQEKEARATAPSPIAPSEQDNNTIQQH